MIILVASIDRETQLFLNTIHLTGRKFINKTMKSNLLTNNIFISVVMAGVLLTFIGCTKMADQNNSTEQGDIVLTQKSAALVNADNTFTFNLLKKIPATPGTNMMVSPLSISLALSMTLNGAETTTKSGMIRAMGLDAFTVDEINQIYLDLVSALKIADTKVDLNIANSIWIKKSFSVLDPFITTNQKYYDAQIEKLEFDLSALTTINGWVNNKTKGKIPTILDQISGQEIMFLINAIYFKGQWKYQFDPAKTQNSPFYLKNGNTVSVPYMKIKEKFGYSEQEGFRVLKMPYGRGKFSMVLILPDEGKTTENITSTLNPTVWSTISTAVSTTVSTDVLLPKFKYSWESELNDILSSLGMGIAFDSQLADFSKINNTAKLFITKVKHKSFIEVNEEGTEAAAVTSIGIGVTSVGPSQPMFYATRPFLYFITEDDTDAILFAGKVENPM